MARMRMIALWILFAAWVGWLAWQSRHSQLPVVSRAQILAADVGVIAELKANEENRPLPKVKVTAVVWPPDTTQDLVGKEFAIDNLAGSKGFNGDGRYVLILCGRGDGPYRIAEIPRSPSLNRGSIQRAIYPDVPGVLAQLRAIAGPSPRLPD